ncbi:hypothetical protein [Vibrio mediterranei]|jgi:uncharacterized GH25 family protein|uniref:hypothetical protein n=1 Tax=Vibrio mediterranei TaxID=689 RepID=UPI0022842042|nr:hypothetical protein [Vibrio mediterranei]MCY9855303.1 hypothetical protein [Vibrio mediterranei]
MKKFFLAISAIILNRSISSAHAEVICRAAKTDDFVMIETFGFDMDTWKAFYIDQFDNNKRVDGEIKYSANEGDKTDLNIDFVTYSSPKTGTYEYTQIRVINIWSKDGSIGSNDFSNFNWLRW